MASFCHKRVSTPRRSQGAECWVPRGHRRGGAAGVQALAQGPVPGRVAGSVPAQPPSGHPGLGSQTRARYPRGFADGMDLTDLSSANSKYLIGR